MTIRSNGSRLAAAARGAAVLVMTALVVVLGFEPARAGQTESFLAAAFPTSNHALTGVEYARRGRQVASDEDYRPARSRRSGRSARNWSGGEGEVTTRRRSRVVTIPQEDIGDDWQPQPRRATGSSRSRRGRGVRVASLGGDFAPEPAIGRGRSLAGGGITWVASASCLVSSLRSVVSQVAQQFGSVTVNSTCRSHAHNARVGGAPRSHHLTGNAVDFRVHGASPSAVHAFLRSHGSVGGLKHYGGGLFHIDTAERRSW